MRTRNYQILVYCQSMMLPGYVQHARWAIVATGRDLAGYKEDVSLLLMSFRLLSDDLSPVILFRFFDDKSACNILREVMSHDNSYPRLFEVYDRDKLVQIDESIHAPPEGGEYIHKVEELSVFSLRCISRRPLERGVNFFDDCS